MMHRSRRRLPPLDGLLQSRHHQPGRQRTIQSPPDRLTRVPVDHHRQIHKLPLQPDVGDVRDPQLVHPGQCHSCRQVEIHLVLMLRVGSENEFAVADCQQVVLSHDPQHPLVVDRHTPPAQLHRHAAIAVAAAVG